MPPLVDKGLAGLFIANFLFFASQKVTQNIKDDIGDKSVFTCAPPTLCVQSYIYYSTESLCHGYATCVCTRLLHIAWIQITLYL